MNFAGALPNDAGVVAETDPLPPEDRLSSRSHRALDDLYRSQGPRLLRFFSRKSDRVEAEDLVQEAFMRYADRAERELDNIVEPEAYLTTVATNILRNRAKLAVRRAEVFHQEIEDDLASHTDVVVQLEQRDELRRLNAALHRLRPRARAVFVLKRVEGMTYNEIAERMSMSVKAVKKQMARALHDLRRDVGPLR